MLFFWRKPLLMFRILSVLSDVLKLLLYIYIYIYMQTQRKFTQNQHLSIYFLRGEFLC
jgi:hypothetical protein